MSRSSLTLITLFAVSARALGTPDGYDEAEAKQFASLSSISYCDNLAPVYDWSCVACKDSKFDVEPGKVKVVDAGSFASTRVVVAKLQNENGCLVSFRGTDDIMNWVRNLDALPVNASAFQDCVGCYVHEGFYRVWLNIKQATLQALSEVGCDPSGPNNELHMTGHSMGAAVTHLAMFQLAHAGWHVAKTYTFEAPRVGNKPFADAFAKRFADVPTYRVTNNEDPVVHVPAASWGYTHVNVEVHYDSSHRYKLCEDLEDPTCADQFTDWTDLLLHHSNDHCRHNKLMPNGDFCNPVGCAKEESAVIV